MEVSYVTSSDREGTVELCCPSRRGGGHGRGALLLIIVERGLLPLGRIVMGGLLLLLLLSLGRVCVGRGGWVGCLCLSPGIPRGHERMA